MPCYSNPSSSAILPVPPERPSRTDVLVSGKSAGRILVGSYFDFAAKLRGVSGGEAMSDRRRFLKGLTSLPLATG